jgi:predicted S18 family serine protease
MQLPGFQPLDPEALTAVDVETPPVEQPAAPSHGNRRAGPPAIPAPKTDPPSPVAAPAEPERAPIQEVMPADEQKRLQDAADQHKRETRALLDQARGRALSPQEKNTAQSIEQLLRSSDDSQSKGDMRTASDLAYKALVLARDLQNVR